MIRPISSAALPPDISGREISEKDAFDILCAQCLTQEQFPQHIINTGVARGWSERIQMLGRQLGWEVTITIKDIKP